MRTLGRELRHMIHPRALRQIGPELAEARRQLAFVRIAFDSSIPVNSSARPIAARWVRFADAFDTVAKGLVDTEPARMHQLAGADLVKAAHDAVSFSVVVPGVEPTDDNAGDLATFAADANLAVDAVSPWPVRGAGAEERIGC